MQLTNVEWFPGNAKSITSSGAVQAFNWIYIQLKYGTFEGHDFYLTNREVFNGATSYLGMLLANSQVFFEIIIYNLKNLIPTIMSGIWLPKSGIKFINYLFQFVLFAGIIYGAFRTARDRPTKILLVGSLVLAGVTIMAVPKWRYMFPMIPVYILAASWYGAVFKAHLKKSYPSTEKLLQKVALAIFAVGILSLFFYLITDSSTKTLRGAAFLDGTILAVFCAGMLFAAAKLAKARLRAKLGRFVLAIPTALLLIMFSASNVLGWAGIMHNIVDDVGCGRLRLLTDRKVSMKLAFPTLASITHDCRGIMSLEPTFFGAFLDVPQDRIFAVWEIPPFGHLGNSPYKGLNPDRIDCVLVSTELATGIGMATNHQIRYQNYIKPYIDQLMSSGAIKYEIPFYGHAIVLRKQRNDAY